MGFLPKLLSEASPPSSATEPCPEGSQNCLATTWTAPPGISSKEAIQHVKESFDAYPQEGQNGIDKGGWKLVGEKNGSMESGNFHVEFKSGSGFFAKLLNGGDGFVDDVLVNVQTSANPITARVRSSSRMGKSDLGVNKKRLQFLGTTIGNKHNWQVPEPEYRK